MNILNLTNPEVLSRSRTPENQSGNRQPTMPEASRIDTINKALANIERVIGPLERRALANTAEQLGDGPASNKRTVNEMPQSEVDTRFAEIIENNFPPEPSVDDASTEQRDIARMPGEEIARRAVEEAF